jgi:hypothetical protein
MDRHCVIIAVTCTALLNASLTPANAIINAIRDDVTLLRISTLSCLVFQLPWLILDTVFVESETFFGLQQNEGEKKG